MSTLARSTRSGTGRAPAAAHPRTALACAALLSVSVAALAAPAKPVVRNAHQADSLLATPASKNRDKALTDWAKNAHPDDLAWLLRRPAGKLGAVEVALLDAALARSSAERVERRERWLARRAAIAPRVLKKGEVPLPALTALRPDASVFSVGSLLPDSGEYAGYTRAVRAALAAGLNHTRMAGGHAIALDTLGTGDSDPVRVSDGFARLASTCDVVVGELLSVSTLALATAARATGVVVVSPTATDERIGDMGPRVFAVGPSQRERAKALADAVLGPQPTLVAIVGSANAVRGTYAEAFAAEVTARGGRVVRREAVKTQASESTAQAQSLQASGATVLFWDGPARDAEVLVRALAAAGASLRVCGAPTLSPEGMRPAARPLLEGVAWVGEDWQLPERERAHVDSIGRASGNRPGSLWIRGYLAGRAISAAVDRGARTPGEMAALLRGNGAPGTLDPTITGTTLPVYVVRGGRVVESERR